MFFCYLVFFCFFFFFKQKTAYEMRISDWSSDVCSSDLSEQFFSAMMKALQDKAMDGFKRQFQQVDALLIDDIQFFAGKDRTQEEFFHTFNALFDGKQQIIMTCDRFPREVEGLEPRLKSRLASGLTVPIDPPDFETREIGHAHV